MVEGKLALFHKTVKVTFNFKLSGNWRGLQKGYSPYEAWAMSCGDFVWPQAAFFLPRTGAKRSSTKSMHEWFLEMDGDLLMIVNSRPTADV